METNQHNATENKEKFDTNFTRTSILNFSKFSNGWTIYPYHFAHHQGFLTDENCWLILCKFQGSNYLRP